MLKIQKQLSVFGVMLALCVVILGAYTRLTDAGLGCPDWPGCYGQLTVPESPEAIAAAEQAFPDAPVEIQKAWNEMIHRYVAGTLGLLIGVLAIISVRRRIREGEGPVFLPLFLLALVTFQAILGMWTVTMNLLPLVVMGHLLGGFATLSLLFLLTLRLYRFNARAVFASLQPSAWLSSAAVLGVVLLVGQIALGGWTAANYAALVCTDLPICEGDWMGRLDFASAFSATPAADTYLYGVLDYASRMTIHVSHRFGAILLSAYLLVFLLVLWHRALALRPLALVAGGLLFTQVALGVSNVAFLLPLPVAVAHNATAVLLLMSLIAITYTLWGGVRAPVTQGDAQHGYA